MINLLPLELKKGYRYGRLNVGLRRWVIIFLVAFVGLGGIATYGLLTLHQSTESYDNQIASSQALFKKEDFSTIQGQVQDISNSFKLVVKVLSQEILFSDLIQKIGAAIPDNSNLTGLSIDQVQGGIDLVANATNYQTASQVQINLSDPSNQIFSSADIESITCQDASNATDPDFPCIINMRALFANNNPFLFINSKAAN
jgi:hypothetical protein